MVLRLAGFLVRHRANVRDGLVPEDYVRHLEYKGTAPDVWKVLAHSSGPWEYGSGTS
ncbi:MAG: hypothetical protein WCG85_14320 [Polyangia bacterium]